jgi:hypothetical protein
VVLAGYHILAMIARATISPPRGLPRPARQILRPVEIGEFGQQHRRMRLLAQLRPLPPPRANGPRADREYPRR